MRPRAYAWLRPLLFVAVATLPLVAACAPSDRGGGAQNQNLQNNTLPLVVIETEAGPVEFEMLIETTPETTPAVAGMVLDGTYDGKQFFQVEPGAFLQFGDPDGELALLRDPLGVDRPDGSPGEPLDRGMVALGWVGDPDRLTHRLIFVLDRLDPALDDQFRVFGRVTGGMDVLERIVPETPVTRIAVQLAKPTFRIRTPKGSIVIEMMPDRAPNTVERISDLVCQGFYNGLVFHRVEPVLIQGGDPLGNGTGGSGQTIPGEFANSRFIRGAVGMARQLSDVDSGDSQFFIMKDFVRQFDDSYTQFGKVISGMDVVDQIVVNDVMTDVALQYDLKGRTCSTGTGDNQAPPPSATDPPQTQP
ncbi:MAG: peptidylprolyl isomerase [Nitrospirota bacterium]|nr:peptidylprolyl isomerase [Nitrospirota bacterium]